MCQVGSCMQSQSRRPGPDADFVRRHTIEVTVRDGGRIRVRPILPDDKERLLAGLSHLSPESRYRRFFSATPTLSRATLAYLTELDYADHFAWVALDVDQPGEPGVGVARYIRDRKEPEAAEAAVAVADDHHRRGIGTLLLEVIGLTAHHHGIDRLVALVLPSNEPMKGLLHGLGARLAFDPSSGCLRAELPAPDGHDDLRSTATYQLLRAAAAGAVELRPPRAVSEDHPGEEAGPA